MYSYINFSVSARRPIDKAAQKAAYEQALKDYDSKKEKYELDLIEYEKSSKEEQIKLLEEQLAILKNPDCP